jgi:hypothetical protein
MMYVLRFDVEIADTPTTAMAAAVPTLDQASTASAVTAAFPIGDEGWTLEITDVERPHCNPLWSRRRNWAAMGFQEYLYRDV